MNNHSRRSFLESTSGAVMLGTFLNLNPKAMGASETIRVALIGARNQGRGVALRHIAAGAKIATLCDIDDAINAKVAPMIEKAQGSAPQYVKDYRRVLDDKDIDAVIIAAPDHWHTHMALAACQAGKDVYLEKPVSQTIGEGQLIRDAARKYNRVMQIGTMRRSADHFRAAAEYVGSGKLGKICLIKAWMCQVRKSIGNPPDGNPPDGVDYDMWLGPAPKRAFNPNRFHYNWRFFWDYGNTELGNQGVHLLDIALWGIQKLRGDKNCLPTRVAGQSGIYWLNDAKEVPDTQVLRRFHAQLGTSEFQRPSSRGRHGSRNRLLWHGRHPDRGRRRLESIRERRHGGGFHAKRSIPARTKFPRLHQEPQITGSRHRSRAAQHHAQPLGQHRLAFEPRCGLRSRHRNVRQ
jgi:predicted dehydrogenase